MFSLIGYKMKALKFLEANFKESLNLVYMQIGNWNAINTIPEELFIK